MIRVLLVLKDLRVGNGIASCIMNYYDFLIDNGFSIDFLLLQNIDSDYMNKAMQHGKVFVLPYSKMKYSKSVKKCLDSIFKNNKYDIIHVNARGPYGAWILKKASKEEIKYRIYHSHNPKNNLTLKSTLNSFIYNRLCVKRATHYLACSKTAGNSIFGERKYSILKNCIDPERFMYNSDHRLKIRRELKIEESTIVIGTVARLDKQKNPLFVLYCFAEFLLINNNAVLVWVGNGSMMDQVKEYAKARNIDNKVYFVGVKKNVNEWYSMMDYFLLPSKFEGLGIVFIEAQASGLPCFGSTAVPEDTEVTNLMHRLDIKSGAKVWANAIAKCEKNVNRGEAVNQIKQSGYDIKNEYDALAKYYNSLIERG